MNKIQKYSRGSLIEQAQAARIKKAEHLIKNLIDSKLDLTLLSNSSKSYFLALVGEKKRISFKGAKKLFRQSQYVEGEIFRN